MLVHLAPDPKALVPRPLPTLVDIMSLHNSLQQLGRLYAWQQEWERLRKWRDKMGEAWLDRPKEVYKMDKELISTPRGHAQRPAHRGADIRCAENGQNLTRIMGQSNVQMHRYNTAQPG